MSKGRAALKAFQDWKTRAENAKLEWGEALEKYRSKLRADGLSKEAVETRMRLIVVYDEAERYNNVYSDAPRLNSAPNHFLREAVAPPTCYGITNSCPT